MPVHPVGSIGQAAATPFVAPTLAPQGGADRGFGRMLTEGIEQVQGLQDHASSTAGLLATDRLTDIHDYTTAATKAQLGVQLTVALRNRAVEAYQEIMRMQV